MTSSLGAPPVLSTPDTHILDATSSSSTTQVGKSEKAALLSDEQLEIRYEISRTVREIRAKKWQRVALQFPDEMLVHSARVYQLLARGLDSSQHVSSLDLSSDGDGDGDGNGNGNGDGDGTVKLTILADTSYGSCCVDEIAAEHVDAEAVVHYGRSCLSPTARLPVLYVYTKHELDYDATVKSFQHAFPEQTRSGGLQKVIVTADVPYSDHVEKLCARLSSLGYTNIFAADIIHDPASPIPNRTIPPSVSLDRPSLKDWHLFHISDPPTSLLLTLTSSVASIQVFQTTNSDNSDNSDTSNNSKSASTDLSNTTSRLLRRRYALVTSLSTVSVWGILINTLSVKNYLSMVTHVQRAIAAAGKKSYLFVVGKINVAKVSNFSEIGGWVVIGCWESSLIDSRDFYRPIITPFELDLALQRDDERQWTGEWRGDFQSVLDSGSRGNSSNLYPEEDYNHKHADEEAQEDDDDGNDHGTGNASSDESDEAPEFDLRTGKYVSRTRPMAVGRRRPLAGGTSGSAGSTSTALAKRVNGGALVTVNGMPSPAAQHLQEKRTWRGLGSDFEIKYDDDDGNTRTHQDGDDEKGALLEEGRTGIAAGYSIGGGEGRT